jgi:hypothetical protein
MRYRLIEADKAEHAISRLCKSVSGGAAHQCAPGAPIHAGDAVLLGGAQSRSFHRRLKQPRECRCERVPCLRLPLLYDDMIALDEVDAPMGGPPTPSLGGEGHRLAGSGNGRCS